MPNFSSVKLGIPFKTPALNTSQNSLKVLCPQLLQFHEWHWEGYSTGVIDAHKDSNAAHHACPFPFKLVWLSKMAIQTGVQQTNHSWGKKNKNNALNNTNSQTMWGKKNKSHLKPKVNLNKILFVWPNVKKKKKDFCFRLKLNQIKCKFTKSRL